MKRPKSRHSRSRAPLYRRPHLPGAGDGAVEAFCLTHTLNFSAGYHRALKPGFGSSRLAPTIFRGIDTITPAPPTIAHLKGHRLEGLDMTIAQTKNRIDLVRHAFWLEWLTLAWMVVEAIVAIASGVAAHSITLLAFGLDSVVELISAGVLIWRLTIELRHGEQFSEGAEQRSSKIGGALLFVLAAYVVVGAAWSLWMQRAAGFSLPGLLVALAAIPIMYFLAKRKIAIAEQIGSRALRADAMESVTCGWLSVVVVVGLAAQYFIGAWWIDSVTSLGIVWFLVKEGREAWAGEECCDSCH
jgi:hypothetical protein